MKSACLWLLAVSLVVGGAGLLTHRAMAEKSTDPTAAPPSKEAAAAPQAKAMEMRGPNAAPAGIGKTKSLQEPAPKDQVVVVGQVLDPDDKPAAAAQVAVVASLRMSDDGSSFTWGGLLPEAEVLGLGRTDDAGRYRVHVPKAMFQRAYAVDVIAGKTGFGLAVEPLKTNPKMRGPDVLGEGRVAAPAQSVKENAKPVDTIVRLAREEVLTGRLIDLEGLPVAGVKVSVVRLGKLSYPANRQYTINADTIAPALIYYQDYNFREKMPRKPVPKEEKEQHAVQFSEPPRGLPLWPQGVVTDAEGRFTLRGLGRGQALGVQVRDERYAAQNLDIQPPAAGTANEVSLALGSPRLLEGAVTDAGTGKPVPHAHIHIDTFLDYFGGFGVVGDPADEKGRRYGGSAYVSMGPQITRSDCQADEQGHFRINPFVGETQVITITAPAGQPYLAVKKTLTWPKGAVRHELNVALPRGVLVRGKVEEAGKPIARSRVDFWCKEVKPSSAFGEASQHRVMYETSAHTASDGSFHAILPSGKWHVLANGPGENYLRQKLPAESITTIDPKNPNGSPGQKVGDKHFFRPDGLAVVDARLGQDTPEVKIVLHRSVLQGRLLGPDGKPVARARMYYRRRNLDWRVPPSEVTGGQFKLPLQDLDTTYSILFLDSENGIGAAVDLSGKQASGQPVTITLAPCGSARVRFVDAGGKPLVNYRPLVWAVVKPYPVLQPHDMQWIKDGHFRSDGSVWLGHADRQHYGKGPMTGADGFVTLPNLIPGGSYRISQFDGMAVDFTVEAGKTRTLADVVIKEPNKPVNLPK